MALNITIVLLINITCIYLKNKKNINFYNLKEYKNIHIKFHFLI